MSSMKIKIGARYRHVMRGTTYEVLGRARMQIGWSSILEDSPELSKNVAGRLEKITYIVYVSDDDERSLWVRPETEFCDGRFVMEE